MQIPYLLAIHGPFTGQVQTGLPVRRHARHLIPAHHSVERLHRRVHLGLVDPAILQPARRRRLEHPLRHHIVRRGHSLAHVEDAAKRCDPLAQLVNLVNRVRPPGRRVQDLDLLVERPGYE